jgi:phosphatidylglycerophosphatase A
MSTAAFTIAVPARKSSVRRPDIPPRPYVPLLLATAFGIGYAPLAPGTFGSAAGLLVWLLIPGSRASQTAAIVALFAAGSWSGTVAERHFHASDPASVVIDEVMGMLITLFMNPVGWMGALGGLFLFRALDILKPYPARRLEKLPGGLGIMADDAIAGVYANLLLRAMLRLANG